MKIAFIIPDIGISGGARVIFEYANNLKNRGHFVSVIYPIFGPFYGLSIFHIKTIFIRIFFGFKKLFTKNIVKWFNLKSDLKKIPILHNFFIEDYDIIVATRWDTAHIVNNFTENKGKKFYLIQGYEIWHGLKQKVNASFKLPLNKIVVSNYLEKKIKHELKQEINSKIIHGLNFEVFHKEIDRKYNTNRILMQYSNLEIKGFRDGLEAFKIIKQEIPDSELILFGVKKGWDVPDDIQFYESINSEFLKSLYNKCDIFLCSSREEGFGLPSMEAMACGCAVVTTEFGAVLDYSIPGKTALVSPPNDPKKLAENVISLLKNKSKLIEIANSGYDYIQRFTWKKSTDLLEKEFQKAL